MRWPPSKPNPKSPFYSRFSLIAEVDLVLRVANPRVNAFGSWELAGHAQRAAFLRGSATEIAAVSMKNRLQTTISDAQRQLQNRR
jgi:hypothetical protein